jgi:ferric-chelate reductase
MIRLVLFSLLFRVLAGEPTLCIESLNTAVSEFTFYDDNPSAGYYTNICNNDFGVHTLWLAAKLYCTPTEFGAGSILAGTYCSTYGMVELTPFSEVEKDFTDEYINSLIVVYFDDINATKIWNESLLISRELYQEARRTTVSTHPSTILVSLRLILCRSLCSMTSMQYIKDMGKIITSLPMIFGSS